MYTINLKTSTKITEQRITADKPTKEIKLNHKKDSIWKKAENVGKENKELLRQTESKMIDLNSITLINVKYVSSPTPQLIGRGFQLDK